MRHSTIDKASALLGAMANEKRLEILVLLTHMEMASGDLAGRVGLSQSALSQHLSKLRRERLVERRREAQSIYYSVRSSEVSTILEALAKIYGDSPDGRPGAMPE